MAAPVNTVAPVLSGTPALASVLSVTDGTWTGALSLARAWLRDGAAIAGATGTTYTLARADLGATITVRVTATPTVPADGATIAVSNALGPLPGTLIVEDGTGMATAESFASVAEADVYHDKRGNSAWALASLGAKEAALRNATDYMEQEFRYRWDGFRYSEMQFLSWPRWEVRQRDLLYGYRYWTSYVGYDVVPVLVQNACAELALRALAGSLKKDQGRLKSSTTVGPISVTYEKGSKEVVTYSAIEDMLAPFFGRSTKYSALLTRA